MIFRRVPANVIGIGGCLERDTMKRLCRANHSSKIEKFIEDGISRDAFYERPGFMVTVTRLEGKRLLCRAGRHQIVTDRKPEDGGSDSGCSSGELLLLAIGSCATGSIRTYLEENNLPGTEIMVDVGFEPTIPSERDAVAIIVTLSADFPLQQINGVKEAAISGGVVSRILLGSHVEVTVALHTADTPQKTRHI